MSKASKIVVDQLINDLHQRPDDFVCDDYTLTDTKTQYEYWIANGLRFYRIRKPYELRLGRIQALRFKKALDKWKATVYINACAGARKLYIPEQEK